MPALLQRLLEIRETTLASARNCGASLMGTNIRWILQGDSDGDASPLKLVIACDGETLFEHSYSCEQIGHWLDDAETAANLEAAIRYVACRRIAAKEQLA